ncbi:AGAP000476-PA [Anopheles gambiae str. PEST]|uniref:AGAP000476-PA n=2 Tax=gambiae species complex TaxID=44542 RepID=Q7QFG7_ANOGA|nr:xaa-Pro aminopeptidase ApepP [Anopheles gambiae]EAA06322.4 AGAP000476-PA [Anopheles gambiae str. PEST]
MKHSRRYLVGISALLVLVVGGGVALGRALNKDDELAEDRTPKSMDVILAEIRSLMRDYSIEAYIVPSVDAHNSEYISEHDRRLQYVTNFTGSAGTAIIMLGKAALWTDSRYHLQADGELDAAHWTLMREGLPGVPTRDEWLLANLSPGALVGTDPFLIASTEYGRLGAVLAQRGYRLIALERNLVDIVWNNRPPQTADELLPLPLAYSGRRAADKVQAVRVTLQEHGANAIIVSALDEIAWLLNLRGSDILYNPVFFAYLIVSHTHLHLYTNADRINATVRAHLASEGVGGLEVRDYRDILPGIDEYVRGGNRLMVSTACSQALYAAIPADQRLQQYSPVAKLKAVKNAVEAAGMRRAHVRDGAAVVRYLHWLEQSVDGGNVTELSGAAQLHDFRRQQDLFVDLSFAAISAFGPNGAIVHYSPSEDTDRPITRDGIYLIDSGGQYLDGTTDVTRSVHLGEPTAFQRECFTRVLKGFLSVAAAVFPVRASGTTFDVLARKALWDVGLDYGHGTGHGIGAFLGVHEYPPSFVSNSASPSNQGLVENMFSSNEPGYYEPGQFGVRIEDIVQVVNATAATVPHDFNGRGALTFHTNTLVPIQQRLIERALLSAAELAQLNAYHRRVLEEVGPLLLQQNDPGAHQWLTEATKEMVAAS